MALDVTPYSKRNYATLLERVNSYAEHPLGEIERLAREAFDRELPQLRLEHSPYTR